MTGSPFCGASFRAVATLVISSFLMPVITGGTCFATGYCGPGDYLSSSEVSIQASPEFYWELEAKRLAKEFPAPEKLHPTELGNAQSNEEKTEILLKSTSDADVNDFAAALKEGRIKPTDSGNATQQHQAARDLIASTDDKQTAVLPEEFDSEFADYHRGAFAFRLGKSHWEDARKAWEALLNRPAEERHYRSVWAAFMLGKISMKSGDYAAAVKWFQKTRELAKDGFSDSLGMAADSYGWEGRCEWKQDHPEKAAPLFLTQLALGDESAIISLKALIPDRAGAYGMLNYGPEVEERKSWTDEQKLAAKQKIELALKAAAADPLLRRLVTAHILATKSSSLWDDESGPQSAKRCTHWLEAIKEAKVGKVEDAAYLGWVAYAEANYAEAAHWLELAKSDTPAACWLRSKLQRRAGRLEDAAHSMQQAWQTIIKPGAYTGWKPVGSENADNELYYDEGQGAFSFPGAATGDYGLLRLARGEFVQAMDTFLKGGLWADAAYVAERVLTTDELKAYVDRQPQDSGILGSREPGEWPPLRYLVGRRLVREARYKEAADYLKPPYDKLLKKYVQTLNDGANEKLPKQVRANAWLTAAWLARHDGMELMGTEVAPDGFGSRGLFEEPDIAKQRLSGKYSTTTYEGGTEKTEILPMVLKPSARELQRLGKQRISPDIRYHYRIIAAGLAIKGSRLLQDNTEELADVLNTAGKWVKDRDEKLGDRYYQIIERRCPNTEIGKAAIAKHWFVNEEGPWCQEQQAAYAALHNELGITDSQ